MSMVKRYDMDMRGHISGADDGDYVRFWEYDALAARLAETERLLSLAQFEYYCGPRVPNCTSPFCEAMRAAGKPFINTDGPTVSVPSGAEGL